MNFSSSLIIKLFTIIVIYALIIFIWNYIGKENNFELIYNREDNLDLTTIIEKEELEKYDYNIYSYGGNIEIKIRNQKYTLREALLNDKIDMSDIIDKCIKNEKDGKIKTDMYLDGGSKIYKYEEYWIIKCNQSKVKDVYIGMPGMELNNGSVKFNEK